MINDLSRVIVLANYAVSLQPKLKKQPLVDTDQGAAADLLCAAIMSAKAGGVERDYFLSGAKEYWDHYNV